MKELLKIAQQDLDDYSLEIKACMVLNDLSRSDLQQAVVRLSEVCGQMDALLVKMIETNSDKIVFSI